MSKIFRDIIFPAEKIEKAIPHKNYGQYLVERYYQLISSDWTPIEVFLELRLEKTHHEDKAKKYIYNELLKDFQPLVEKVKNVFTEMVFDCQYSNENLCEFIRYPQLSDVLKTRFDWAQKIELFIQDAEEKYESLLKHYEMAYEEEEKANKEGEEAKKLPLENVNRT